MPEILSQYRCIVCHSLYADAATATICESFPFPPQAYRVGERVHLPNGPTATVKSAEIGSIESWRQGHNSKKTISQTHEWQYGFVFSDGGKRTFPEHQITELSVGEKIQDRETRGANLRMLLAGLDAEESAKKSALDHGSFFITQATESLAKIKIERADLEQRLAALEST